MLIPKGTKFGHFQVEKPLSEVGGMATVYLANVLDNPKLKVAIKIARTDSYGAMAEDILLQREAELLSRWDWRHPGIVRLYPIPHHGKSTDYALRATEVINQPWFIVMEYLRGFSLAQNLGKIEKFPLDWKLELFYQVLCSVSVLHQKGYAHRDLKPDNIVFREPVDVNEIPQPVLIDFALATNGERGYTVTEESFTPEYSSPEVILTSMGVTDTIQEVCPSDIYSLGIILYEIITGKLVPKRKIEKTRTTTIKQFEPDIPGDDDKSHLLALFIRNMVKRDPYRRPTMKQVLYALEEKFLPPRICM